MADALGPDFTCVLAADAKACAAAVAAGTADLVRTGSDDTAAAVKAHGLVPAAAEEYGLGEATAYWSVAVVPASFCEARAGKVALADLKGAKLCSSGYRKGAGWTVPVGALLAGGTMKAGHAPKGVAGDAAAVASFFGPVCAPRKTSKGPRQVGAGAGLWPEGLCDGCLSAADQAALGPGPGGKPRTFCEENDKATGGGSDTYAGYGGAIECLLAAAGTKNDRVVMFNKADAKSNDGTKLADLAAAPSLRLVCPVTGTCAPLADYRNCNMGRVRSHAVLGRRAWVSSPAGAAAVAAMAAAPVDGLIEGADAPAPFYSKDAKSVADCEAGGGRCASDFDGWFGLTRSYTALDGTKAKGGPGAGAIAGIVCGSLAGLALVVVAGVALKRRSARRHSADLANQAFSKGTSVI